MIGKTTSVQIDVDGIPVTFVLRRPTFSERGNQMSVPGMEVDPVTGSPKVKNYSDAGRVLLRRLCDSIVEPLEWKDVDKLGKLPEDVVDYLAGKVNEISNVSPLPSGPSRAP